MIVMIPQGVAAPPSPNTWVPGRSGASGSAIELPGKTVTNIVKLFGTVAPLEVMNDIVTDTGMTNTASLSLTYV